MWNDSRPSLDYILTLPYLCLGGMMFAPGRPYGSTPGGVRVLPRVGPTGRSGAIPHPGDAACKHPPPTHTRTLHKEVGFLILPALLSPLYYYISTARYTIS